MMSLAAPLESGCFQLLSEALAIDPATPGGLERLRSLVCTRVCTLAGAEAAALLTRTDDGAIDVLEVQPESWRSRLGTTSALAALERILGLSGNPEAWQALGVPGGLVLSFCGDAFLLVAGASPEAETLGKTLPVLCSTLGRVVGDHQPAAPIVRQNHSRAIFDAVNDAIMVHEVGTGAILDVNERMCEMFGLTYDEALWMDMGSLSVGLSPCTQDDAWEWMRKAVAEGPQTFEWIAKHTSGRLFWIEINLRVARIGGVDRLLSTARDITERKRSEADQAARLKRSEAQNAVFVGLAGVGHDYESAMDLIVHHLAVQVGDLCVLNVLDEKREFLHSTAIDQPYIDGRSYLPDFKTLPPFPIGTPGAGAVARDGRALQLADPSGGEIRAIVRREFQPYLDHFGVHSLLIVPMRSQGQPIGTITLARCGSSRPYSAEDLAMLQNLADRSALALVNARLYKQNLHQAELLRLANAELEQRVAERTAELEKAMEALHRMAVEDGLTGLANRRRFNEVIEDEIRRAHRNGTALSLLMCDVDFFKRYNDAYGHQGGDDCLRMVGKVFREVFKRAGELPARYGGEEFAAVLPGVAGDQALQAGERLRQAITERNLPHKGSDVAPHVTLSIGICAIASLEDHMTSDWFIARADEALYQSKSSGRNRVTVA